MSLYLAGVSYLAMALAGFLIGGAFQLLGLAPTNHHVAVFETQPTWNYTTFLDIAFLALVAVMAWRFLTTGGVEMLRAMGRPLSEELNGEVRDPVCGMSVNPATSSEQAEYAGATYHFCSAGCRSAFEKDPARYAIQPVAAGHAHSSEMPGGAMESRQASAVDPVCGMSVDPAKAEYRSIQNGETHYFCSAGCKASFDKDPARYIGGAKK
jgi:YHS domain-containing protein